MRPLKAHIRHLRAIDIVESFKEFKEKYREEQSKPPEEQSMPPNCGTIGTVPSGTMRAYKRKLTAEEENDRILDAFESFLNPLNNMNDLIDDEDEEDDYDYDN